MKLYASNGSISRSGRRYAHAHRQFGVVDLKATNNHRVADLSKATDGEKTRLSWLARLQQRISGESHGVTTQSI